MSFTFGKCKCLHTGHGNLDVNNKMGDTVLDSTVTEKDSGVTISADMKVSAQCGIVAPKGNQIRGLVRRNITYKEKRMWIRLKEYRGDQLKLSQSCKTLVMKNT